MKKSYDVVIIGASISGMEAAKELSKTDLSVLVVEREKEIGNKACAHGITGSDVALLPQKLINYPLQKLLVNYKDRIVSFPRRGAIISSIDRKKYLNYRYDELNESNNIDFLLGVSPKVSSNDEISIGDETIKFKYLIGADGSNSIVRKYLKIDSKKIGVGIHYMVPKKFEKFEIFFDDKLFGTGYAWIFPNENFTSIGCGGEPKVLSAKKLQENFCSWLKEKKIDVTDAKFQGCPMNCDYRGYRFGNIFLVGDAAGLISGLTGKGMHAGIVSARQAVSEIMGKHWKRNLVEEWLEKKKKQELFMPFLRNTFWRKVLFKVMIRFLDHLKYKPREV